MSEQKNDKGIRFSIPMLSIMVLLIIQIIGLAFGYGQLNQQVAFNREIIKSYQQSQTIILDKLNDMNARLTKLEVAISQSQ